MTSPTQKRILITEDYLELQNLLVTLFRSEGYAVEYTSSGEEALEYLRTAEHLPHLIITDFRMQGMDALEFRQHQVNDQRCAHIPIVLMSADVHIHENKLKMGAADILKKPVDLYQMLEMVQRWCA